jgi:uncharacterized protein (DUF305 family)
MNFPILSIPTLAFAGAIVLSPVLAMAQGAHSGHAMPAAGSQAADTTATKAYREANAKMHRDMDIAFTDDADIDFVRGMIPHHQGAIDMAKVVLQHGKDEKTRQWAGAIIREQEREIAEMQAWLKSRGK